MVKHRLTDGYTFPGYKPYQKVEGFETAAKARIIRLKRIQKKRNVRFVTKATGPSTIARYSRSATYPAETLWYTSSSNGGGHDASIPAW
jgi:hypothetical protein